MRVGPESEKVATRIKPCIRISISFTIETDRFSDNRENRSYPTRGHTKDQEDEEEGEGEGVEEGVEEGEEAGEEKGRRGGRREGRKKGRKKKWK